MFVSHAWSSELKLEDVPDAFYRSTVSSNMA
jgi:hypothetical protein